MDVKDMPEEWFASSGYKRETDADGGERPALLVYVDNHPEGYTYPLYRVLEALKDMGVEPYVFGPVFGSLEGYRMTRKEFEEWERGLTPLLFLCHGATFEYAGRTFSVQDSAFTAPDYVHLHHRMLRHDMDFLTYNEVYGGEYLYNEMVDRLAWLLVGAAQAVLGTRVAVLPQGAFWRRRLRASRSATHVFVGTPVVPDTLPFWVRFLLRIMQRGGHPVLGGPQGAELYRHLSSVWDDLGIYALSTVGVLDMYYAVISAPTDYKLETAAREHAENSGARTLQWIQCGPGFFTGVDWHRTLGNLEHFDPIRDARHFPTYCRSHLFSGAYVPNARVYRSEDVPRANMNGDILPSPSIPLPEPVKHENKEQPMSTTDSPQLTEAEIAEMWDYVRDQARATVAGADPVVVPHLECRIMNVLDATPQKELKASSGDMAPVRAYLRDVLHVSHQVDNTMGELLRAVMRALASRMAVQVEIRASGRAWRAELLPADDLLLACIPGSGVSEVAPMRAAVAFQKILSVELRRYPAVVKAHAEYLKQRMEEPPAAKEFFDALGIKESVAALKEAAGSTGSAQVVATQQRPATSDEQETDGLTGAASIAAAEDARILERLKKMAESTDPERTSSTQQRPADEGVEGNEWIERWVSDERVPPPTVSHVPTVLVFEDDPTSLLHPAFLHALGEHFRLAGYRMLVLPAPDSSFRRSKGAWTKEKDRRSAEFLRELKGDISAVLHITWGDPSSRDFSEEARDLLRALPYSGKGVLEVVHLEARKLRSSRYDIVDAASWQLDADAATYLFRSLIVLHNVLWNNATEEQQSRWPLPSPADYPTANMLSFSVFPVQQASTLLPVAVVFPSNRKGYTLRNAKNLARFFRGLGMEILPVSDSVGIATRSNGEFASILARHYARWVPVLIVEGEDAEANSMWDSPLNWRTVQYRYTESKERRLDRLEEFLEAVRDHLREGSPHHASREKFHMDRPTMIAIDVETSELNPND